MYIHTFTDTSTGYEFGFLTNDPNVENTFRKQKMTRTYFTHSRTIELDKGAIEALHSAFINQESVTLTTGAFKDIPISISN